MRPTDMMAFNFTAAIERIKYINFHSPIMNIPIVPLMVNVIIPKLFP